jgi:soluble lytic murein transglycosylase
MEGSAQFREAVAATLPAGFDRIAAITVQSESAGNPNAVSLKGARGLMQVMPATARDPGFGIRPSNGTPADDIRVGREYLAKMRSRYGGDLAKMWAAYNWGPGNMDRVKDDPNWLSRLPAETRNYVAKNIRALRGK